MDGKNRKQISRLVALAGTWAVARLIVDRIVGFLLGLDTGWLIVLLIKLIDEVVPPIAGFAMLMRQYYREAMQDDEPEPIPDGPADDDDHTDEWEPPAFIPEPTVPPPPVIQPRNAQEPIRKAVEYQDVSDWNMDISAELREILNQHIYFNPYTKMCAEITPGSPKDKLIDMNRFIVLDIETTGLSSQKDKIIEIAAVKFENYQAVSAFTTLVDPEIPLPKRITSLTGITQSELTNAPLIRSIKKEFCAFIGDAVLIGHNLENFDMAFLRREFGPIPNPTIDTLDYARNVFPEMPSYKLSYLKDAFDIHVDTSHRALQDVKATFFLLTACIEREHDILINNGSYEDFSHQTYIPPIPERKPKYRDHTPLKSIQPTCESINPNSPLYQKKIVFTGTMSTPRNEAMQMAVNAGAMLRGSVSRKTHYLVVGQQDTSVVGADGLSSKQEKALLLNSTGEADIKIIDEQEFLALVGKE